jgi:hypothetical protein
VEPGIARELDELILLLNPEYLFTMNQKEFKVLICKTSTGQVLNLDAATLYSGPETEIPYTYFGTLHEAEEFASGLAAKFENLEIVIYSKDEYIKQMHYK